MTYKIISRADWGAAPSASPLTPMTFVAGWYVHYVGSDLPLEPTQDESAHVLRGIQAQALGGIRGEHYVDIEYSFGLDPMGRIFELRGWGYQSAATLHHNTDTWSVVYLGGPDTPVTKAAHDALLWLTQEGARRKPLITFVKPHSEAFATACPGDGLRASIPELQAHLHDTNTVAPPVTDWVAVAKLAAFQKALTKTPLHVKDHGPLVVSLKALLAHHGFPTPEGNVYGPELVKQVKAFKIAKKLPNHDGTTCGALCVAALLRP